ncbi:WXG100-like domain-containing protein [Nocardia rhamnosiphila]
MSIHIPSEVVFFLNILGIPYPDVDVDQVRELSRTVEELATEVRETYDEATNTVGALGSAISGDSYQAILVMWAQHKGMMSELDTAFGIAATALDIAADVIEAIQIAVLIELAALAASFIASIGTPAGPVTGPAIAATARYLLKEVIKALMWYIAAEVMMKAIQPLLDKFDLFLRDALRPPGEGVPSSGPGGEYHLDPDEVQRYIRILDSQAEKMKSHGEKFVEKMDNFDFATPGLPVTPADWSDPLGEQTPTQIRPDPLLNVLFPGAFPESQQPTAETSPNAAPKSDSDPGADSSARGEERPDSNTGAPVAASPDNQTSVPETVAPGTVQAGAPGSSVSSMSMPSAGIDSVGHTGGSASSATDDAGHSADRAESEVAQRGVGETGGITPTVAAQSTPSASASAQSQTSATPAGQQRSADAATNKAQGGAARPTAGAGSTQGGAGRPTAGSDAKQPSAGKTSRTPWSRAGGKAARVGASTKRSDEKAPAVSVGEAGNRGEADRTAQSTPESPPSTGPQVFAPAVEGPPKPTSSGESDGQDRDVRADPPSKDPDPSTVGGRPQAG